MKKIQEYLFIKAHPFINVLMILFRAGLLGHGRALFYRFMTSFR